MSKKASIYNYDGDGVGGASRASSDVSRGNPSASFGVNTFIGWLRSFVLDMSSNYITDEELESYKRMIDALFKIRSLSEDEKEILKFVSGISIPRQPDRSHTYGTAGKIFGRSAREIKNILYNTFCKFQMQEKAMTDAGWEINFFR